MEAVTFIITTLILTIFYTVPGILLGRWLTTVGSGQAALKQVQICAPAMVLGHRAQVLLYCVLSVLGT